jgi:hypothetical protein
VRCWSLATFLGEALGFGVPGAIGAVAVALAVPEAALIVLMIGAGSIEGAALGLAQSIGMQRDLPFVPRWDWVCATALAAACAWALGMTFGTQAERLADVSIALAVIAAGLVGITIVLSIGTAQWLVLRRYLSNARWWIAANAAAWLLGVGVVFAVMAPTNEDTPAVLIGLLAVAGGVAMAAIVAVVTGYALARIVATGRIGDT